MITSANQPKVTLRATGRCLTTLLATLLLASAGVSRAATVLVTNTNNALTGSLRQAIQDASPSDTVAFHIPTSDPGYNAATGVYTITLTSGLVISKPLIIDGQGQKIVITRPPVVDGGPYLRILNTTSLDGYVLLNQLTISKGEVPGLGNIGGGGIYNTGQLIIYQCTITDNHAERGGGLYNSGMCTVQISTFAGNTAAGVQGQPNLGAAIYNASSGTIGIIESTISGNVITSQNGGGAGVANDGYAGVLNSVIAGNSAAFSPDVRGAFSQTQYNLIGIADGSSGFGGSGSHDLVGMQGAVADPKLGVLQDNGGPTFTMRPMPGSLLIDQGYTGGSIDQRGIRRPQDDPAIPNAGDGSDIGAAEVGFPQAGTFTVTNTAAHDDGVCTTDDCTFVEALNAANANPDANTVTFAPGVRGTIFNTFTPGLTLIHPVTIVGPGARTLTISGNNAARIFNITAAAGQVSISGLTLTGGKAPAGSYPGNCGGAISNSGTLNLTECAINGNTSPLHGGAIFNNGQGTTATVTLKNCTLALNSAAASGGCFFNAGFQGTASLDLTNCTLSQNSASEYGGAVYNDGVLSGNALLTLTNCTLDRNVANLIAGGVYNDAYDSPSSHGIATTTLRNTILRTGTSGANLANDSPDASGRIISQGNNLSSDAAGGDGATGPGGFLVAPGDKRNTNPRLDILQNNGGQTDTVGLLSDSPAINAGNDGSAPTKDQRGYFRSGVSDIGAFEFNGLVPSTLANISTRLRVETGDNVLIGGFIITGTQPKTLIIRAIGTSLSLGDKLSDPTLELHGSNGLIEANNNWSTSPRRQIIIDTTIPPPSDLESAIVATLPANGAGYTAIVRGTNNGTGIGVVEAYDLDRSVDSKLANISTRGFVQTGDNVLIAGTIVLGSTAQKVIIRAIGPSLPFAGKLENPTLELRDGNGALLEANDNWVDSPNKQAIIDSTIPPTNDFESAIVRTLTPASYTAIVRGVNDTTGIAVVEVYALP